MIVGPPLLSRDGDALIGRKTDSSTPRVAQAAGKPDIVSAYHAALGRGKEASAGVQCTNGKWTTIPLADSAAPVANDVQRQTDQGVHALPTQHVQLHPVKPAMTAPQVHQRMHRLSSLQGLPVHNMAAEQQGPISRIRTVLKTGVKYIIRRSKPLFKRIAGGIHRARRNLVAPAWMQAAAAATAVGRPRRGVGLQASGYAQRASNLSRHIQRSLRNAIPAQVMEALGLPVAKQAAGSRDEQEQV